MLRIAFVLFMLFAATVVHGQGTVVHDINIHGNKVTKEHIILRELGFAEGDTIPSSEFLALLRQAESNLRSSGLFNFVNVQDIVTLAGTRVIQINVVERWYLWPVPIFENAEPNFNTWWQHRRLDRTNYGIDFLWNNFRGRRERLRALVRLGFTERLALEYQIPYLTKQANLGLLASAGFWRSREVNALSLSNRRVFVSSSDEIVQEVTEAQLGLTRRFGQIHNSSIVAGFQNVTVNGAPQETVYQYLQNDGDQSQYFSLTAHWKTDRRDYLHYPTRGYMVEGTLTQNGFGLLENAPNLLDLTTAVHAHKQLLDKRAHISGAVLSKWNIAGTPPYYLQRGLGYQTHAVRGYELYVMDGQSYALIKTNARYCIFNGDHISIPAIGKQQFSETLLRVYAGVHFDAGYVDDRIYLRVNPLNNEWQYGGGIGLDFVTYYDKVLRLEYSYNKLGEGGIYLHFTKPI